MKSKRFTNKNLNKRIRRTFMDFLKWKLFKSKETLKIEPLKDFKYPISNMLLDIEKSSVQWVGHCTFIIKTGNKVILTDPIWSKICSPVSFIGPRRVSMPGIKIEKVNNIDYVLISHNHYDHLDKKTVLKLFKKFPNILWIVPIGLKKWFLKKKIYNVIELHWWENFKDDFINCHAVPAQHYSGRGLFDGDKSLWCGYVLECLTTKKKVYFAGDTGYNMLHFKMIGKTFKSMDLSLIPIGTYWPREFMGPVHVNPEEAVKIHTDVNSKKSIGMHFKTFKLSDE
ncbi:MAG: hypothetical protein A2888_03035, partial [Chlamydiae bacterium RIFCSPLOWO2_01_FULL_28_7]